MTGDRDAIGGGILLGEEGMVHAIPVTCRCHAA